MSYKQGQDMSADGAGRKVGKTGKVILVAGGKTTSLYLCMVRYSRSVAILVFAPLLDGNDDKGTERFA
jgi:hypothetical protein